MSIPEMSQKRKNRFNKRKIVCLVLSVAMLLSLFPLNLTFAFEPEEPDIPFADYAAATAAEPAGGETADAGTPDADAPDGSDNANDVLNTNDEDDKINADENDNTLAEPEGDAAGEADAGDADGADANEADAAGDGTPVEAAGGGGAVADGAQAGHTVSFYIEGALDSIQIVEDGKTADNPGNPDIPQGKGYVSFLGWYTEDAGDGDPYDFKTPVTEDLDLEARFSGQYLVQFLDGYGEVFLSKRISAGDTVPALTAEEQAALRIPPDMHFDFWSADAAPPYAPFGFGTTPVNGDTTLRAVLADTVFVYFVTYGSQTPHAAIKSGGRAPKPAQNPDRLNYTFNHWSATPGGAGPEYDWNLPVTADLTLYASWTGNKDSVTYKIIWWLEAPGFEGTPVPGDADSYIFAAEEDRRGTPGEYVTIDEMPNHTGERKNNDPLRYAEFQYSAPTVVSGFGNTIVNAYLTRKTYTVTFDLEGESRWLKLEKNSAIYYGDEYSIQIKYEQNVTDIWPSAATAEFGGFDAGFTIAWITPDNINSDPDVVMLTRRNIVSDEMMPADPQGAGYILSVYMEPSDDYSVRYWLEALPGQTGDERTFNGKKYILDRQYDQDLMPENILPKTIIGLEYKGENYSDTETGEGYDTRGDHIIKNIYYGRESNDLLFEMGGADPVAPVRDIKFGQSLKGYEPAAPTRENYTFVGWYKDSYRTFEFDFDSVTMPAYTDLIVFAKWESKDNTVTFYDGTERLGSQGVANGAPVNFNNLQFNGKIYDTNLHDPAKGSFVGWQFYPPQTDKLTPFPVDLLIYEDTDLYVNWRTDGFTVTYTTKGAGAGSVAPADGNSYKIGSYARVLPGPGINPPDGEDLVFIGWKVNGAAGGLTYYPHSFLQITGNMELDPYFVPPQDTVQVYYHANFGQPPEIVPMLVEKNTIITLPGETVFQNPRQGYKLPGWQDEPGDAPRGADGKLIVQYPVPVPGTYSIGGLPVTLYAVWDSVIFTIDEFYVSDRDRTVTLAPKTVTRLDGATGYRYEKTANAIPAITDWVAVGYAVDDGAAWYAPRQRGTPVPPFGLVINPVGANHEVSFLYRRDRNRNRIPDDEEEYTITEYYRDEGNALIGVAPPLTNPKIITINEASGFEYVSEAPAIPKYAPIKFNVDQSAYVNGNSYTFTMITANHRIDYVYKRIYISDTPNINPIYEGDRVVTGEGVPGAEIEVIWPNGDKTYVVVDPEGNWLAEVPDRVDLAENDVVTAIQTERGKDPSVPAQETVGGGGKPGNGKSDTPDINVIYVGDRTVGGYGVPGSKVTVLFPNGDRIVADVTPDTKWSADVPAGLNLAVGDEVFAMQKTPGKEESDWAQRTVIPRGLKRSDTPNIDPVTEGDRVVTGQGVPGAKIEVSWPNDGGKLVVDVDKDGIWTAPVPANVNLVVNDIITAVQTEPGKLPSLPAQETVGGGDKPGNGKSDTPDVDPIYEGDKKVTGRGIPDSMIIVKFPNNTTVATTVDKDGKWSVVPTMDLKAGDVVYAAQKTGDKEFSDWAKQTVRPIPDERSAPPTIDKVTEGDSKVKGTGVPGAIITVTWPNGAKTTAEVGDDGKWESPVPQGVTLKAGDKIKAEQTEKNKLPSAPVEAIVQAKIIVTPSPSPAASPEPSPTVSPSPAASPSAGPSSGPGSSRPGSSGASGGPAKPVEIIKDKEIPEGFIADHIRYIIGYPEGDVRPDNNITRAEVAEIIYRLLEASRSRHNLENPFSDVPDYDWYTASVKYLASIKIIVGYPDGTFRPDNAITRAEFATMISGFDKLTPSEENNFTDIDGHWAVGYINSAAQKGWVAGYPDGKFRPEENILRDEVITVINRMLNRRIEIKDIPKWAPSYTDLDESHWAYADIIEASIGHEYNRKENGYETWIKALK